MPTQLSLKKPSKSVVECAQRTKPRTFKAPSESVPGLVYVVRYMVESGTFGWVCGDGEDEATGCKAFKYRKPGVVDCKHVRHFKAKVCSWISRIGPEQQTAKQAKDNVCPRCGGLTQIEIKQEEDDDEA